MARFSQQEQNQMRQDAMRRANEMHGRVPFSAPAARQRGDYPPQETERVPKQTEQAEKMQQQDEKKDFRSCCRNGIRQSFFPNWMEILY